MDFIPERQDSDPEPSSPGSPLSHEDPQVRVKPWCALNGTMPAACFQFLQNPITVEGEANGDDLHEVVMVRY